MLRHECLSTRIEVVNENHGMIIERFGGEDLPQGHQIGVLQFLPLVHQNHTFGVDQPEPVDASQGYVLTVFRIGGFVNRGYVAKRLRFVQWRGWGRL